MRARYPAELYVAVHDGNPGDVDFYRRQCQGAGSVLELGCGDARVLAALAEPGRRLVGVDIDPDLLAIARARVADGEVDSVRLIEADMARLDAVELGGAFDRVILPYGSVYCLLDDEALDSMLASAVRFLAPGGKLILDVWAADGFHEDSDPEDLDSTWIERVKTIEVDGRRYEVLERSAWDKPRQRIDVTYVHVEVGTENAIEGVIEQRYLLGAQLRSRLAAHGLTDLALYGDFDETPYDGDARFMIAVASRAS